MGKITIKHYPNKDLKPIGGQYPLYVQITYNRKVYKIKSSQKILEYANDEILKAEFAKVLLEVESKDIERTILALEKQGEDRITSKNISLFSKPFKDVFNDNFCKLVKEEVPNAPDFFHTNKHNVIKEVVYFLNVTFNEFSENIGSLHYIFENIFYNIMKGKTEYLCIDFYNGDYFKDVQNDILFYFGEFDDEPHPNTNKILEEFKKLIEI